MSAPLLPAPTMRPNGKLYRPRRPLRVSTWENDMDMGLIVLGTLDRDLAAAELARVESFVGWGGHLEFRSVGCLPYGCGRFSVDQDGWWRLVPWGFDGCGTWVDNATTRGTPGVMYLWDDATPCACPDFGRLALPAGVPS